MPVPPLPRQGGSVRPVTEQQRTVADVDEDELIGAFANLLPHGRRTIVPSGDDAAVVAAPGSSFVVSTDALVQARHFRVGWGSARDVGWRAAMQNMADIAAMGATPTSLVVALVLPRTTPVQWVIDLARGLAEACGPRDVGIVGGDVVGGEQLVVAATVHGELLGERPMLRRGARPGDVVAHAGALGWAAAGFDLLDSGVGQSPNAHESLAATPFLSAFLRPQPPLDAAAAAVAGGVCAMMDVSDGLLRDAARLARASGVVLDLDLNGSVLRSAAQELAPAAEVLGLSGTAATQRQRSWLLGGGEDHGLLACFPGDRPVPSPFRPIGTVRRARPGDRAVPRGRRVLLNGSESSHRPGWDHFDLGAPRDPDRS